MKYQKPKCKKVRLKSEPEAEVYLEQVKVLNASKGKEKRNKKLHTYMCNCCGWWHVGHYTHPHFERLR